MGAFPSSSKFTTRSGDKTAAQAMRDAAAEVNRRIRENLRMDPALKEQWERLVAKSF
jgi:hypothetical protein